VTERRLILKHEIFTHYPRQIKQKEIAMTTLILQQHQKYPLTQKLSTVMNVLQLWMARHQQRKQLALLDEHELKDIGLNRVDVIAETEKPFWK
jgi:uncharacterized protein YjiS (DUF1127 family)